MILEQFMIDVGQEANIYLLADEETRVGLMVDAGGFDPVIIETAAKLDIRVAHILLTHLHWDHVDSLPRYLKSWPGACVVTPAPLTTAPRALVVHGGEVFQAGPFGIEVLHTAGHTPESVCYHCGTAVACFVGDALFSGSVGGTASDRLHRELVDNLGTMILTLPEETELLPGHGPVTTVRIEKTANPFFRPGFGRNA